jgi:hypothetical protein
MNSQKSNIYLNLRFAVTFIVLCILLIFNYSCKKPKDEVAPVITFTSPQSGAEYDIYDTIHVKANVTDNERVEYISVTLTNNENNILFSQEAYYENKSKVEPDLSLIIDDNQLESGIYYIRIIASDGINIIDNFREIRINEIYPEMKYPVIITAANSGKCSAWAYKNQSWSLIQAFQDTIEHSELASAFNQLYVSGKSSVGFKTIDLTDNKTEWQAVNQQHISGKWFTGIDFQYPYVFLSSVDGNIRALDKSGNVMQLKVCNSGTYAGFVQSSNNKVFATSTLPFPETYYISAFYTGNNVPSLTTPIAEKPVALKYLTDNKLLVCSGKDSKSTLWSFDGATSVLSKLRTIDEVINDVALISSNVVLLATNGNVYTYDISANSLINVYSSQINTYTSVAYNYVDQQIYIGSNDQIKIINYPENTVAGLITTPEIVTDVMLLFNK